MPINPPAISSVDYSESYTAFLEIVRTKPNVNAILDPPAKPQSLVGYYDVANDRVLLFVVSDTGNRYIKVG